MYFYEFYIIQNICALDFGFPSLLYSFYNLCISKYYWHRTGDKTSNMIVIEYVKKQFLIIILK